MVKNAVVDGTTQERSARRTAVPQCQLQRPSAMRGVTAHHALDKIRSGNGGAFLIKFATQEFTVHFHDLSFPVLIR